MNNLEVGKIKSLALRDFLTYDELKFYPGENLNIIIGPNGTGKSTIVAGIILGCGGKPVLLSRSKDISDYVKNGKTKAHIEIELVTGDRDGLITFHRTFDRNSKESFSINGQTVSYKEYLQRIKKFNIQVDNLCMFLPQDRVQDFTKLNPQELLHNTQISVCSTDINEAFAKLLKTREQQKNNSKANADLQTRLDDNKNRNEQLRVLIDNNKLKDKLVAEVDLLMKKKAWKEVDDLLLKYQDAEVDMKTMTDRLKEKNDRLKPLQKKQENIAGTKNELKNSISKLTTSMNENVVEIDKLKDGADEIQSQANSAKQTMKNVITSVQSHKKQIENLELLVNLEKEEFEQAKHVLENEGIVGQIKQCDADIGSLLASQKHLMEKRNAINSTLDENIIPALRNCERKIAMLGDTNRQRLDILRNNFEDSYKAYEWLQSNRQSFQGRIFNPVMTEITVKEKDNAKYVENTIANKDLLTFVCTDKNDMARLIKKLRNELRLQVNIAYAEDTDEVHFKPPRDITEYPPQLGLYSYLIDMIDGPAPVINYLCKLFHIHTVAVGDDLTYQNASQVPNELRVFFSTNHRFQVVISRYTGAKSSSSSHIQSKNLLNVGVDKRMKDREERNLLKWKQEAVEKKNIRGQIEAEIKNNEDQLQDMRNTKKQLQSKLQKVKMSSEKLRKKQAELENLKNRKIDVEVERKKFKANVDELVKKCLSVADKRVTALEEYKKNFIRYELAKKKLIAFNASTGNLEEQIQAIQREIDTTRDLYDRVKVKYDATKNLFKSKEQEALKLTDGVPPSSSKFKYKEEFKKIPEAINELQNEIEEMQGRIECIQGVDPRILTEYEDRSKEIEDLEHQLANEQHRLYNLEKDLNILHATWYPSILEVVEKINSKFSSFFNKMGFVGEVELIRKEERDYADYGIQIRVQYRDNEKLQALNRHVQSGGERAVAIAVYTLSLQHLTSVPFRCVDEINQGMDPKNERKIFQMLVDITCQPDQSQYFFVTPKLLPDLPHSDLMTISVVHNGKNIEDPYIFLDGIEDEEVLDEEEDMDED